MSTLPKIVQAGHPVLREAAKRVPEEMFGSAELISLTRTMVEVMRTAPGVGLAAPQIGVGLQVVVMEDVAATMARLSDAERKERGRTELPLTILINPELVPTGEHHATFFEGCLSVGGYMALVERHHDVRLVGQTVEGQKVELELSGWPARIAQHELDHLAGTLYVDRMITRSLCENREMGARYAGKSIEEIRKAMNA